MVGVVAALAAVGAGGFWAGRTVLVSPEDPLAGGSEPVTYAVAEGRVGRSLQFVAVAEWGLTPLAWNAAVGVVTSVDVSSGDEITVGQRLFSVDLRPVVAAVGAVPAFRDLGWEAAGEDVAQLQRLLAGLGFFTGEADGVFGESTAEAVAAWQESLGLAASGTVRLREVVVRRGDVVFVPELPTRVALSAGLAVGVSLSGGEQLLLGVSATPMFRVPLTVEQRSLVPLDAVVWVSYAEGVWEGRVEQAVETPELGRLDLIVTGPDGGSLCGGDCARWVSFTQPTDFSAEIVVVPETVGPVVPVGAIGLDAGNQPFVTTAEGERVDVTIVESAQGVAVVQGVEPGTVILLRAASEG